MAPRKTSHFCELLCVFLIVALVCSVHSTQDAIDSVEELEWENERETTREQEQQSMTPNELSNRNQFLEWLLGLHNGNEETEGPELDPVNLDNCPPCSCGIPNTRIRIVGGVETKVKRYPWMVVLMYNRRFYCGASLINNMYLLTAAHCVDGFYRENMSARLLEHNRNDDKETVTIERNISRIIKHSGYSDSTFNNDIALLRLSEPVEWDDDLRPVCLPQRGRSFSNLTGLITGWGVKSQGGSPSPILHEVSVPIMSNEDCRKTRYGPRRITDNMICAGLPEGMKDACQGDSGGPMHYVNGSQHDIVGVVSWGEGCAKPGYPGVYSRVNRYLTWIARNTVDACPCRGYQEPTTTTTTTTSAPEVSSETPEETEAPETEQEGRRSRFY